MGSSACCLFFWRPLCLAQTTTYGRDLESSECIDMHHLLRKIIERRCDRILAVASQRPALICKTIETVVTENEMVEQADPEEVSCFSQSCGERPILGARSGISGRMVGDNCYSPDDLRNNHVEAFLKC